MGELVTLDLNPATKDTEPAKPKPQEPAPKPKPKPTAPKDKSPLPVKAPSKPAMDLRNSAREQLAHDVASTGR